MKRVVEIMFRFKSILLDIIKSNKIETTGQFVDINLLQRSESSIIKLHKERYFQNEFSRLINGSLLQ